VNVSTLVWEDEQTSRALTIHLVRNISDAKAREALIRSAETLGRQLIQLATPKSDPPIAELTRQQTRVLRELAEGRSSTEIASHLHISPRTLRTHIHHINRKLHARGRLEAVIYGHPTRSDLHAAAWWHSKTASRLAIPSRTTCVSKPGHMVD
jgi:DNA-binding NarL/FixJ family response regulator